MDSKSDTSTVSVGGVNFADRLMSVLGGRYDPIMRRSVQSAILFQASSDVEKQFSTLKIFQRKLLLFEAANKIIDSLHKIPQDHRSKLLVRTQTGSVPLNPELAWRRTMFTKRESEKLLVQVRPFLIPGKTHDQVCDEYVQSEYVSQVKKRGEEDKGPPTHPFNWEFSHLKEFIIYRLFYNGDGLEVFHSPASSPFQPSHVLAPVGANANQQARIPFMNSHSSRRSFSQQSQIMPPVNVRRGLLREIREHLDLLKDMEGVISDTELNRRKRELYLALPPIPMASTYYPPADNDEKEEVDSDGGDEEDDESEKRKRARTDQEDDYKVDHDEMDVGHGTEMGV